MDVEQVMVEIGQALSTIDGLRVHDYPVGSVSPPAAVVGYPDEYTFDATYGRGMDTMTLAVWVTVGPATDRQTRTNLAGYLKGSGTKSVKAAVDGFAYTACDNARVSRVSFDATTIGAVPYLVAVFDIEIGGRGA